MAIVKMLNVSGANLGPVSLRCPACSDRGAFEQVGMDMAQDLLRIGLRRCPHPNCRAILFVVWNGPQVVDTYPPQRIDFDAAGIPEKVVGALTEAITCHATQCYTAAAIMVRKTLELLCEAQNVKGDNLKNRIAGLRERVVLPKDLLEGLDELRILGNDAVHVESKDYENLGREEVEVGIEVAKEVLKAAYQHGNLVNRLRSLKRQPA
jgi:hypothetical protein